MAQSLNRMELGVQVINADQVLATDLINGEGVPTGGGGVPAEVGSIYMQNASGTDGGALWLKFGDDDVDWILFADSGGGAPSGEDAFQNTFTGKTGLGSETPTYSSNNVVTDTDSLETAIGDLDAAVGADGDLTPLVRTGGGAWQVVAAESAKQNLDDIDAVIGADAEMTSTDHIATTNTIYTNLSNLDGAIGADSDLTPLVRAGGGWQIVAAESTKQNLDDIDANIGADIDMASTTYIAPTATIYANLSALDSQVTALSSGLNWLEEVDYITVDAISGRSGTGDNVFSDNNTGSAPTLSAGDRVASTSENVIYVVDGSSWIAEPALATDDTFFVYNTYIDPVNQEGGSAFRYNGSALVKVADFDFELADSINLTSGYAASAGIVAASDTIEVAIQKLDGSLTAITGASSLAALDYSSNNVVTDGTSLETAIGDLDAAVGADGDLTPVVRVGGANAWQVVAAESAKQNLDDIDACIGADAEITSTNHIAVDNTIYENLSALDAAVGSGDQASYDGLETTDGTVTVDTVLQAEVVAVEWLVTIWDATNSRRKAVKVYATHNNGSVTDDSQHIVLNAGTGNITTVTITVDADGTNMNLKLANSSATAMDIRVRRHKVDA